IKSLGGPDVPAVGGAIGFDRAFEAAEEQGLLSQARGEKYAVACMDEEYLAYAAKVTTVLRSRGLVVELIPDITSKLGKQFQYAEKIGANKVLLIGESEYTQNKASVKDLV